MKRIHAIVLLAALASLAPAPPIRVSSIEWPVRDEASLFSKSAIKDASAHIKRIEDDFGLKMRIEVIKAFPEEDEDNFANLSRKAKQQRIKDWAIERVKKMQFEGLYLIICKADGTRFVQIAGDLDRRRHNFTDTTLRRFQRQLERELARNPDRALGSYLDRISTKLDELSVSEDSPLPDGMAAILLGGMVGLSIVLLIVHRRLLSPESPTAILDQRPAILGSLFGVPAGFWIYDRLYRSLPVHGVTEPPPNDLPGGLTLVAEEPSPNIKPEP